MKTTKWLMLGLILASTACTTLQDARNARHQGTSRTYPVAADAVWQAAPEAMRRLKLEPVSTDREEGVILAQRRATWPGDDGENIALFIEPKGPDSTEVEVVSKRVTTTQVWNRTSTDSLLDELALGLKQP